MTNGMPIVDVSLVDMTNDLARGAVTSEMLTCAYLDRIADIDARLDSVLAPNPHAVEESRAADMRRRRQQAIGPLDGVPILIKDNIDIAGLATTAGSLALIDNVAGADAPVVKALRTEGAVILGKTNLSEWSNFRSPKSTSGWSAVGGLTRNPYDLTRSACGSSSGSAAAVAASLALGAVGTETDGSVVWPAAICGVVGLKPTIGLISQIGVVPITHEQDTPGPLARNVTDTAFLLNAMSGKNTADPLRLDPSLLRGVRLGALRFLPKYEPETLAVFERALDVLRSEGATIIDIETFEMSPIAENLLPTLLTEFKADINAYLATRNHNVQTRTLADLIAFNRNEPRELKWFGQEFFEMAQQCSGPDTLEHRKRRSLMRITAGPQGIDRLLHDSRLIALVAPTNDPAWSITLGEGDSFGGSAATLPATAGYPHLTVPSGYVQGLPVGLSFIGGPWSEQALLSLGFGFEKARDIRRPPSLV